MRGEGAFRGHGEEEAMRERLRTMLRQKHKSRQYSLLYLYLAY